MKKIIIVLILFSSYTVTSQIFDICDPVILQDIPAGSYIKDADGKFNKFDGTWIWTNGSEQVTFKLQKVVHQYFSEYDAYADYMIGNYKYTKNYGAQIVVNTIRIPTQYGASLDLLPESHPMYVPCPENATTVNFIFTDVVLNKKSCEAIFEFLPGNTSQMKLTLKNREGMGVLINEGDPMPVFNHGFTIPNEIVLTKQP